MNIKPLIYMFVGMLIFTSGYFIGLDSQQPCPSYYLSCPEPNISIIQHTCPEQNLTCNCDCPKISQLQEITHAVYVEKKYHKPDWTCMQMSLELQRRLENAGYRTKRYCNGIHCWVEVRHPDHWGLIVEATAGRIPTPQEIEDNKVYSYSGG